MKLLSLAGLAVMWGALGQTVPPNLNFKAKGIENSKWEHQKSSNPGTVRYLYRAGRKQMRLDFLGGDKRNTFYTNRPGFKPPKDRILKLDVYSPVDNPPDISVALTLTYHFIWTESRRVPLKKGWNQVRLSLNEPTWMSEVSNFKPTLKIGPKPDIRFMNIVIWNGKQSGHLVLEGIVPEALAQRVGDKQLDSPEYWRPQQQALAGDTHGFLVWESNRTGAWRLWRRNLDGSGLKMLTPDEKGRDHFCPHICPNGKRVAYLSFARGTNGYTYLSSKNPAHLRIINADGSGDRLLRTNARTYLEDRAVVWVDNDRFIYISGTGSTRLFDLRTSRSTVLLDRRSFQHGWLIDAGMTFATKGYTQFSPYIKESASLISWPKIDGCQPYFSHDGQWGFWMIDSGGPIRKIHLPSGRTGEILQRFDDRLPPSRGYVYFPMLSCSGNLLTFGASPTQHDHFTSDYDIFVARTNPATLDLIGKPVRYTFHPATDRFPDVHYRNYALGQKIGEVPFTCAFELPEGGWTWSKGAGSLQINKPGIQEVAAKRGTDTIYGQVIAMPSRPPELVKTVVSGEKKLLLTFDEPINAAMAQIAATGTNLIDQKSQPSPNKLAITLVSAVEGLKNVTLTGILDCAQKPNSMPPKALNLASAGWPKMRDGLIFLWDLKTTANQVLDAASGNLMSFNFDRVGAACFDGQSAMRMCGGYMESPDAGSYIGKRIDKTGAFTLTFTLKPATTPPQPTTICSITSGLKPKLRLYQHGTRVSADVFDDGGQKTMHLGLVEAGLTSQITISMSPSIFRGWLNGRPISELKADLRGWQDCRIRFGADSAGRAAWFGSLRGIAAFDRSMNTSQVSELYNSYRAQIAAQKRPLRTRAKLRLLINTRIPTLEEIKPYKDAIIGQRYLVEEVLGGKLESKQIFVYHWALIGGRNVFPPQLRRPGAKVTLDLEPLETQPEHLRRTYGIASGAEENEEMLPEYFAPSISAR